MIDTERGMVVAALVVASVFVHAVGLATKDRDALLSSIWTLLMAGLVLAIGVVSG